VICVETCVQVPQPCTKNLTAFEARVTVTGSLTESFEMMLLPASRKLLSCSQ
jgi:hypothetical protein